MERWLPEKCCLSDSSSNMEEVSATSNEGGGPNVEKQPSRKYFAKLIKGGLGRAQVSSYCKRGI